jgi:hypothetical protein
MTSNRNPHIALIQPGELLASVPHLLGFHPADSLIVVGLHGSPETTISVVLRSDLPPPSGVRALAEYLLVPLTQHNSTSAIMIVVGGVAEAPGGDLPHQELLARCESVLIDGGFPVAHQLWTPNTAGGRRWHCYDEFNCTGIMPDPTSTELAAAAMNAGLVTYDRREDIVATLKPEPDETLARRSTSLNQLTDEPEPNDSTRTKLNVVQSAIDAAGATPPTLSDNDVIRLSRALADHRVRDTCLDFDELPDVAATERLWTALARATPAPERAEPACLLAFSAYARGDGVLAGIALAEAEAADPGHRLASLLRSALALGLPPRKIRTAGIRAATFARKALAEDQPPTPTHAETPTTTATLPTATATEQTAPTTPAATELPEPATDTTQTASASANTPTAAATLFAAEQTTPTILTAVPVKPPAATQTAPGLVEPPASEATLVAAPTEVATVLSDEPASAVLPLPDSPAAATIPASLELTVAPSSTMSAYEPATFGPVPAEPPAIVAIAPPELAPPTPDSVPPSDSTAQVAAEPLATETIPATPTMAATSIPTDAPTTEPQSSNASQTVAPAPAEPAPTTEIAAPTPAEVPTPASAPTAELATTSAATAEPSEAAPVPVTSTAPPNNERSPSDIPTEAHQEAS